MIHCEFCGCRLRMTEVSGELELVRYSDGEVDCEESPYGLHEIGE
jgi:hypothetical protein